MDAELDRILADDYLGELSPRTVAEIRSLRIECEAVETKLSYIRRIAQGRHDIVTAELDRRRHGGDPADVSALVDRLPQILSDRIHAPGLGRLPQTMSPGDVSGQLVDRLDNIATGGRLTRPAELEEAGLETIAAELEQFEQDVSALRHFLFERIDTLQAELVRRYRVGEARVEELLHEP